MARRRRLAVAVLPLLLAMQTAASQAKSPAELFQSGDYAEAVQAELGLLRSGSGDKQSRLSRFLRVAQANELAEGKLADTGAALDQADTLMTTAAANKADFARSAALRALYLSRMGEFDRAAKVSLESYAKLAPSLGRSHDAIVELRQAYAIVLLRMGLSKQAIVELRSICDVRLDLPDGDPRLLASLHWLGAAQIEARQFDEASVTLKEVVRVRELALGKAHPDTLASRTILASAIEQSSREEAAKLRAETLEFWRKRGHDNDARLAAAMLDALRNSTTSSGADLAGLQMAYESAMTAEPAIDRILAENGLALAKALNAKGLYGQALAVLSDTIARTPDARGTLTGDDLLATQAVVYRELKRYDEAELRYRSLIQIYDGNPYKSRIVRTTFLQSLAELLGSTGRIPEAIGLAREVTEFREAKLGPSDSLTLVAKSSLAAFLSRSGAHDDAIKLNREVLAARRAANPVDERAIASSVHNLAASFDSAGRYRDAIGPARLAVQLRMRLLGEAHPDTVSSLRQFAGVSFSLDDLDTARAAYQRIIAALEKTRLTATIDDRARRRYFSEYAQVYKFMAVLSAAKGEDSALAFADAAHSRTLNDLTGASELVASIVDRTDAEELHAAQAELGDLAGKPTSDLSSAERLALSEALDLASTRLSAIQTRIERKHPAVRFANAFQPISKQKLREAMGSETAILSFLTLGNRVQLLWIAPDGTTGASELSDLPNLEATVRSYLALLSGPATAGTTSDALKDKAVFRSPSGWFEIRRIDSAVPDDWAIVNEVEAIRSYMSEKLLAALPDGVAKAKRWIVIPDGPLAAIPFETLSIQGRMVGEKVDVSYSPSLQMLLSLSERQARYRNIKREPLLLIGAPRYSLAPIGSDVRNWPELAGSAMEVEALRSQFDLQSGFNLLAGSDATERQVRRFDANGTLARFQYIVFSAHGVLDLANAESNAIVLLGDNGGAGSDGFLRAAELITLRTNADLIIVSACQSGVGEWEDGEGVMGLPYALFGGGAAAAILSHWPIADKASATFMKRFMAKVQAGQSPRSALWQTKRDLAEGLEGERLKDPAFWSAFSFYGADAAR